MKAGPILAHLVAKVIEQIDLSLASPLLLNSLAPKIEPVPLFPKPEDYTLDSDESFHFLHRKFKKVAISSAVFLYGSAGSYNLESNLSLSLSKESLEVPLRTIPHFPHCSHDSANASMYLANFASKKSILFILSPGKNGLHPIETQFLVNLISKFGIKNIHFAVDALSTDSSHR